MVRKLYPDFKFEKKILSRISMRYGFLIKNDF